MALLQEGTEWVLGGFCRMLVPTASRRTAKHGQWQEIQVRDFEEASLGPSKLPGGACTAQDSPTRWVNSWNNWLWISSLLAMLFSICWNKPAFVFTCIVAPSKEAYMYTSWSITPMLLSSVRKLRSEALPCLGGYFLFIHKMLNKKLECQLVISAHVHETSCCWDFATTHSSLGIYHF